MNRQEKAQIIEQLKGRVEGASIAVVTGFKGLTVEEFTELRAKVREAGAHIEVVKNTLARLALKESEHDHLSDKIKENCAIAFASEDPVAIAKVVTEFAKGSKTFEVRFGSLEGKFLDENGISDLSKLPSKPELLAKTLGTMNAVPTNFVSLLANVPRGLLNVLVAIKDQKDAA